MRSSKPNFCAVALALHELGYRAQCINQIQVTLFIFRHKRGSSIHFFKKEFGVPVFGEATIISRDYLNKETLDALNRQGHQVDAFRIGTHLVTCYAQPVLGCLFKLVEINGQFRMTLSEDVSKV